MAAKDDYLMDTLIDMGLITQEQVDEASGEVTDTNGVIDVLVAKGELFEESVTMAKATQAGLEMVELEAMQLDDSDDSRLLSILKESDAAFEQMNAFYSLSLIHISEPTRPY